MYQVWCLLSIRNTLYPALEDHELVRNYPPVRGIAKNVFFLTHSHKENSGVEDSASKYNLYEVKMIRELVLYLLRFVHNCFLWQSQG